MWWLVRPATAPLVVRVHGCAGGVAAVGFYPYPALYWVHIYLVKTKPHLTGLFIMSVVDLTRQGDLSDYPLKISHKKMAI